MSKCGAICKSGSPCKKDVSPNKKYCSIHSPIKFKKNDDNLSPSKNPTTRIKIGNNKWATVHEICLNGYQTQDF